MEAYLDMKNIIFFKIILEKNISEIEINLLAKRYSEISLENLKKNLTSFLVY